MAGYDDEACGEMRSREREKAAGGVRRIAQTRVVVAEELRRLFTWEERHRRLFARLMIAFGLTVTVDVLGALLVWNWESDIQGSDIHGFPDALFFATVQVLTVSSSLKNPLTGMGKIVDVALEIWAIGVVTALAGSFSTFFTSGDS